MRHISVNVALDMKMLSSLLMQLKGIPVIRFPSVHKPPASDPVRDLLEVDEAGLQSWVRKVGVVLVLSRILLRTNVQAPPIPFCRQVERGYNLEEEVEDDETSAPVSPFSHSTWGAGFRSRSESFLSEESDARKLLRTMAKVEEEIQAIKKTEREARDARGAPRQERRRQGRAVEQRGPCVSRAGTGRQQDRQPWGRGNNKENCPVPVDAEGRGRRRSRVSTEAPTHTPAHGQRPRRERVDVPQPRWRSGAEGPGQVSAREQSDLEEMFRQCRIVTDEGMAESPQSLTYDEQCGLRVVMRIMRLHFRAWRDYTKSIERAKNHVVR